MWMQELPYQVESVAPKARRFRDLAASVLRAASRLLDGLAKRLDWVHPAPAVDAVLEYHADAGAPEGALYVNGQLVGHLTGVNRL
jgi:hypothetical protein